jgi:elongation factor Ts
VVSVDDIKNLREETGAGVMECKKALAECGGDAKAAAAIIKERGLLKAAEKSKRIAKEGLIESYIHADGKLGVIVEINCETDFVARNADFKEFAHGVAMHIAAAGPQYVAEADIPKADLKGLNKTGKAGFIKENCLLAQPYIRDDSITVGQLLTDIIAKTGENIVITRFVRFALGREG